MAKPVKIGPFKGMCNIQGHEGDPARPEIILNADNDSQGSILVRQGKAIAASLPGAHSLWTNESVTFVVAKGELYKVEADDSLSSVCSIGLDGPVSYETVRTDNEQSVYISGPDYMGRYDLEDNSINSWGISIPDAPRGSVVVGDLEPGLYHICYTKKDRGKMSGNSEIINVNLTATGKGIFLSNVGSNQVWITDPGGGEMQRLGVVNMITQQPTGGEPLPTLNAKPPNPGLTNLRWWSGRMWAFRENLLVYSEPFDPELYRDEAYFDFGTTGTMIAPVTNGLYAATETETFFLTGTDPVSMRLIKVGSGAMAGSLAFIKQLRDFGANIPVWIAGQGIMAGSPDGQVICLTTKKTKLTPGTGQAAAVSRSRHGEMQYLASYKRKPGGSGASFGDSATAEVIRNGKVIST